jgi:hypothetical protein
VASVRLKTYLVGSGRSLLYRFDAFFAVFFLLPGDLSGSGSDLTLPPLKRKRCWEALGLVFNDGSRQGLGIASSLVYCRGASGSSLHGLQCWCCIASGGLAGWRYPRRLLERRHGLRGAYLYLHHLVRYHGKDVIGRISSAATLPRETELIAVYTAWLCLLDIESGKG